ncbi:hypothetical protein P4E94_06615 [Pontiellaceae bacterium B12219]|nr:hypothetical protein [Pontiellaceae bacterium B12219]
MDREVIGLTIVGTYTLLLMVYSTCVIVSVKKFLRRHGDRSFKIPCRLSFFDLIEGYRLVRLTGERPHFIMGMPIAAGGFVIAVCLFAVCKKYLF